MQKEENGLSLLIRDTIPRLSKAEAAVAEYIAANPEEVVNLSVSALAEACGVSEPTVIRACRNLGYSGYQAMKVALIQNLSSVRALTGETVTAEDDMASAARKVFGAASDAVALTLESLDAASMERAAEALLNARRILIFGVGGSAAVAADVQHKFLRLGLDARALSDMNLQAISAAFAGEGDVVFAISHSGSSRAVVDNAALARSNGATVISLSSRGKSPLTETSDICLFTVAKETRYRIVAISSRIAELTLIDALYSYMSFRTGDSGKLRIEKAIENQMY